MMDTRDSKKHRKAYIHALQRSYRNSPARMGATRRSRRKTPDDCAGWIELFGWSGIEDVPKSKDRT